MCSSRSRRCNYNLGIKIHLNLYLNVFSSFDEVLSSRTLEALQLVIGRHNRRFSTSTTIAHFQLPCFTFCTKSRISQGSVNDCHHGNTPIHFCSVASHILGDLKTRVRRLSSIRSFCFGNIKPVILSLNCYANF